MNYEALKKRQSELAARMIKMTMQGVGTQSPRYKAARDEFQRNAYLLKNQPGTCRGMTL